MDIRYIDINEQEAYEEGYRDAISDLRDQLQDSKNKILNLAFDTEPYTTNRRMLLACLKLLDIYSRHYSTSKTVVSSS